MGKFAAGEKPKFDLITASKTKKYKIITAVILVIGVLFLAGGLLLRMTITAAVTPNALTIGHLSNLSGNGPINYTCIISQDETFVLTTSTPQDRALANPITFELDNDAKSFLEIRDKTDTVPINTSHYQGRFWLHIRDGVPEFIGDGTSEADRPHGTLTIRCGSRVLQIKFIYYKI